MTFRRFVLAVCLAAFVFVVACDEEENDGPDERAADEPSAALEPLRGGEVVYLMDGSLPVPTYREEDGTAAASLDGAWRFRADPNEVGEDEEWYADGAPHETWRTAVVPGSWTESFDAFREYEGVAWYARRFDVPDDVSGGDLEDMMLRFGAVFLRSRFYLNGELLGTHDGGYTPVHLDASGLLRRRGNLIAVRADNRITGETVPADTYFHQGLHGWYPHGGITRSVTLHRLPGPWLFKAEAQFATHHGDVSVTLGAWARGDNPDLDLSWRLERPDGTIEEGRAPLRIPGEGVWFYRLRLPAPEPVAWSRANPENLYRLTLTHEKGERLSVTFGYRRFDVRGDRIYLNDEIDFWRGINRHSCREGLGAAETDETIARDVELIARLRANHVRPGHYPVDERLLNALRDAGITVVEEVPVYQWYFDQLRDDALTANAAHQLAEMIERDKNNPAILAWSVGNENFNSLPGARVLTRAMAATAAEYDPGRPTMLMVTNAVCYVPLDFALTEVDLIGLNEYYGWYTGRVERAGRCLDTVRRLYPDKPIILSEFGAGAVAGRHLPEGEEPGREPLDDHSYTEEFQAWFLEQHLRQALEREYLSGVMPWVLADFRMEWDPGTGDPHPVYHMNLKGLVTRDRETEKASFALVREIYASLQ
ncbi:MAG: hypothetical protein M5R36_24705 [Deltaproteobacteria bacterium]|nr:hypothetical protein [Deltaproteobacteria bacterium]